MQFTLVFGLIFALLVAIFAISNSEEVIIKFPWGGYPVSQAIVILGSTAFGAVTVMLLGLFRQLKSSIKYWESSNKIKKLEKQVKDLQDKIKAYEKREIELNNEIEKYKVKLDEFEKKSISTAANIAKGHEEVKEEINKVNEENKND